ncbi:phosphatidylserine synthase 2 [Eurytemora carolleeae]|uniref:phosphatidylserine synthase 2 n=1 Tax=Eurytemora carolleeae TaxID=1294199 RepID=UPI000C79422F|nr:phosphatidylserine synthase 2 [Eurytemora carolleeae]|eukprot:XP_023330653.1 phosphatidylserine synthase 2-like [Eurytemora affinis]
MDTALHAVDTAIDRIKREVEIQKQKSDNMCKFKTAHNWQEEKEGSVEDTTQPSYFWRAHTGTVLIVFICCLVYTAFIETPVDDPVYNGKRGFTVAVFFWVTLGMTMMPDGPFMRPHPALWRFAFACSIFYELLLIYILHQTPHDARTLLKFIDSDLGEPIPEKDYGGNCQIYDSETPQDPWHNIKDKVDIFIVAHLFGYWCKTLIFRDWWLTTVISVMFEFLEYSLEHQLANFSECWWDHWILDVIVCNGGGTILGIYTLRWLSLKEYHWRGLYEIPTYRGKIKRIIAQFSPHGWIEFQWSPLSSFERWIAILCITSGFLFTGSNQSCIFLKNFVGLKDILFKKFMFLEPKYVFRYLFRETFQLLDDPECDKLGRQSWVLLAIVITELLICFKFGWQTITKPLPKHIALWWVLGGVLLVVYTFVKFYLLKPNHIPRPEKERVRLMTPGSTPVHVPRSRNSEKED